MCPWGFCWDSTILPVALGKPSALHHFHLEDTLSAWLPWVPLDCGQLALEGLGHWALAPGLLPRNQTHLSQVTCFWSTFCTSVTNKQEVPMYEDLGKKIPNVILSCDLHPRLIHGILKTLILNKCMFHGYKILINHLFWLLLIQKYLVECNTAI